MKQPYLAASPGKQAGRAPVHRRRNSALAVWRLQFLNVKVDRGTAYLYQGVAEEPTVGIGAGASQVPAGARHRKVRHALKLETQQLMDVAGNHIPHSVLPGELVQSEVWILERHVDQPGWPVRKDKLHGLRGVGLQVLG